MKKTMLGVLGGVAIFASSLGMISDFNSTNDFNEVSSSLSQDSSRDLYGEITKIQPSYFDTSNRYILEVDYVTNHIGVPDDFLFASISYYDIETDQTFIFDNIDKFVEYGHVDVVLGEEFFGKDMLLENFYLTVYDTSGISYKTQSLLSGVISIPEVYTEPSWTSEIIDITPQTDVTGWRFFEFNFSINNVLDIDTILKEGSVFLLYDDTEGPLGQIVEFPLAWARIDYDTMTGNGAAFLGSDEIGVWVGRSYDLSKFALLTTDSLGLQTINQSDLTGEVFVE